MHVVSIDWKTEANWKVDANWNICILLNKLLMNIIQNFLINKTFNILVSLKNPVFHRVAHSMGSNFTATFPICHTNKVIYHGA